MTNKGRRYAPAGRGTEKAKRRAYRRDPEFARFLAKELDMEATPVSYRQALRRAYLELPRDMPVRRRPLRAAMKGLATVAALLVLASVSLLGANSVYPQLTESLPGLGMLFKNINGAKEEQQDFPPPVDPAPQLLEQEEDDPLKMPAFEPVRMENSLEGYSAGMGQLTVENAWSDGEQLYLDMALRVDEKEYQEGSAQGDGTATASGTYYLPGQMVAITAQGAKFLITYGEDQDPVPQDCFITINGFDATEAQCWAPAAPSADGGTLLALSLEGTSGGTALYTGVWLVEVPAGAQGSGSLDVGLDIGQLYTQGTVADVAPGQTGLGFQGSFAVKVDQRGPVEATRGEQDNGVLLESASYTPTCATFTLNVPFMGFYDYSLLPTDLAGQTTPYGMYGELTGEDGRVLDACSIWDGKGPVYNGPRDRMDFPGLAFLAQLPPQDRGKLVLTLYQYEPEVLERCREKLGLSGGIENPVVAEFTFDLEEGKLAASQNYKEDGLGQLDWETSALSQHHSGYQNGVYARSCKAADWLWGQGQVEFCVDLAEVDTTNLALNCYMDGSLEQVVYTARDLCVYTYNGELGQDVYDSGGGYFWGEDPPCLGDMMACQESYQALHFAARYPDWVEWDEQGPSATFDRFELVDLSTGQVLVEDAERSYRDNLWQVLTGRAYRQAKEIADGGPANTGAGEG